jgi:hypothetical protein
MHAYACTCVRQLHMTIAMDEMSLTWTLLMWTVQAVFDLFAWVLLIMLVVTHGYHGRHDHPARDR